MKIKTMKIICSILSCLALLFGAGSLQASNPMGADEILVSPWDYEGQSISLNVVCVKPANFQSPLPDIIFYHAMTMASTRKPGGEILIAVPKDSSSQFASLFGMDPHGGTRILTGTLLLGHHPHPPHQGPPDAAEPAPSVTGTSGTSSSGNPPARQRSGVWFVDYKGLSSELLSNNPDIQIPDGPGGPGGHPFPEGPGGGPNSQGPRKGPHHP